MTRVCLVTGGAGFIGCAISSDLVASFDRVVAVDNLHPQIHPRQVRPEALDKGVELVVGDVTEAATWDALLADVRPNVVVHLAAETGTGQSLTEATRHALVNVVGTTRMLDGLSNAGITPEKFVLSSSRAVYGEGAWKNVATGEISYPGQRSNAMLESKQWDYPGLKALPFEGRLTNPSPTSVYGGTKLAQEHVLKAWALSFGSQVGLLRLQNVYGPGQSLYNPYTGIVSLFARLAREGKSIPIYEDGEIIRDFVFIDDVAAAIVRLATGPVPTPDAYDIGSGENTSILELGRMIARHYGAPEPHINGMYRNGDVRHASCDIARTVREMGWSPKVTVQQGVTRLCHWIETQLPPVA